jgi:hypothetical protein
MAAPCPLSLEADQPLTASFNPFPGLNFGCLEAGIDIALPVWGLRPVRAFRSTTTKLEPTIIDW